MTSLEYGVFLGLFFFLLFSRKVVSSARVTD